MSGLGAELDWENQTLYFSSTGVSIPAVHRKHAVVNPRTPPCFPARDDS